MGDGRDALLAHRATLKPNVPKVLKFHAVQE